jgi:hypothetical protein
MRKHGVLVLARLGINPQADKPSNLLTLDSAYPFGYTAECPKG